MFEACSSGIESILVKSAEDECLSLRQECSDFAPVLISAFRSCGVSSFDLANYFKIFMALTPE